MKYFRRLHYYKRSKQLLDQTNAIAKEHDIPAEQAFFKIDPLERQGKTFFIIYYEAAAYHIELSMGLTVTSATLITMYLALLFST